MSYEDTELYRKWHTSSYCKCQRCDKVFEAFYDEHYDKCLDCMNEDVAREAKGE